jgi:hypothetical protein
MAREIGASPGRSGLGKELLEQLKPKSSALLQQARSLAHEPTKDQLQSLADEIDQVAQAGRNAQGRMDSLECPKDSFVYKAIRISGSTATWRTTMPSKLQTPPAITTRSAGWPTGT